MADHARLKLDEEIAECSRTALMLDVLADAATDRTIKGQRVYRNDALTALLHAKRIVQSHRGNLEEVRAVYDGKVHGVATDGP